MPGVDSADEAERHVVKAIGKGLLKTISKMGISTIQSYCGAQIFEAVGLEKPLIDRHFCGTASRIGGVGLETLAQEALDRHERGYGAPAPASCCRSAASTRGAATASTTCGTRRRSRRCSTPSADTNGSAQDKYDEYSRDGQRARRAQGDAARPAEVPRRGAEAIPLDEVEPAKEIVKRFATGAMSLGSISTEAHENLAIAMNRLGGRSNTGEGGEDPRRFRRDENGDLRRSAIKQVASGRFGVTIHYLVNADQLQIKMAQGAKPGEGGQLPGHKVDEYIGSVRHTTPGVGPDLAAAAPRHLLDRGPQAAHLRPALRQPARAGLGEARLRGRRRHGRRGRREGQRRPRASSPATTAARARRRCRSIVSAGAPWEIGLAETQQTLLKNDLRSRIVVQTDGQLKTGRDVAIAAMLGADEMGFSTAPLIATGCIMMRACHLNTCPVGIATQDPELRKRFQGTPEHVVNFFFFVAEELRGIMASLGVAHDGRPDRPRRPARGRRRDRPLEGARDRPDAPAARSRATSTRRSRATARSRRRRCSTTRSTTSCWRRRGRSSRAATATCDIDVPVRNVNRCVGGMLSSRIAELHGRDGPAGRAVDVTSPARPASRSAAGSPRA